MLTFSALRAAWDIFGSSQVQWCWSRLSNPGQQWSTWSGWSHVSVCRRLWLVVTKTVDGHVILLIRSEFDNINNIQDCNLQNPTCMNIGMSNSVELMTESSSFTCKDISRIYIKYAGIIFLKNYEIFPTSWMLCILCLMAGARKVENHQVVTRVQRDGWTV